MCFSCHVPGHSGQDDSLLRQHGPRGKKPQYLNASESLVVSGYVIGMELTLVEVTFPSTS